VLESSLQRASWAEVHSVRASSVGLAPPRVAQSAQEFYGRGTRLVGRIAPLTRLLVGDPASQLLRALRKLRAQVVQLGGVLGEVVEFGGWGGDQLVVVLHHADHRREPKIDAAEFCFHVDGARALALPCRGCWKKDSPSATRRARALVPNEGLLPCPSEAGTLYIQSTPG
jgi:hypothetical protein